MRMLPFAAMTIAALAADPASATDINDLIDDLRATMSSRVVIISLDAQNARLAGLDQAEIERLDQEWRAETESDNQPLIAQLMGNPLSSYLIRKKAESNGLFTEIFVFDARGMNVGQSSVTSDYWQGDEDKFEKTVAVGPDAVFIDEIEFDEEMRQNRRQVSFVITDPETREPIGGATVEVNIDELERRP